MNNFPANNATRRRDRQMYKAGWDAAKSDTHANYDAWKRAMEARDMDRTNLGSLADLAIRQVLYGNETGTPDETTQTETT